MYVNLDKEHKSFVLEHCWKILKGEDKWKSKMLELAELEKLAANKKKKGATKEKRSREEEVTQNNDLEQVGDEEAAPKKRPDGKTDGKKRDGGVYDMLINDEHMGRRSIT
jgi:hypothetical protein